MAGKFADFVAAPGETYPELVNRLMKHAACDHPTALKEARRIMTVRQIERARTVEELRPILLYLLERLHKD